jgi:RNA recognition motif-containing protein
MLVKELKEKLKSYGLSTEGLKKELEARLETHEMELNSTDPNRVMTQQQPEQTDETTNQNEAELNDSSDVQIVITNQNKNEEVNNLANTMASSIDVTVTTAVAPGLTNDQENSTTNSNNISEDTIETITETTPPQQPKPTEEDLAQSERQNQLEKEQKLADEKLETEQKLAAQKLETEQKLAAEKLEKEKLEAERLQKIDLFVQEQSDLYKQIFTQTKGLLNINVCKSLEECININKLTLDDLNNEKLLEILQSTSEKCVEVFGEFLTLQPEVEEPKVETPVVSSTTAASVEAASSEATASSDATETPIATETSATETPLVESTETTTPQTAETPQNEPKIDKPTLTNVEQLIQMLATWKKSTESVNGKRNRERNQQKKAPRPGPSEEKLAEILARTGYSHEVSSGQRKYGGPPPNWSAPEPEVSEPIAKTDENGHKDEPMETSTSQAAVPVHPGVGCECFVGKLPRDLFEDELIPLFEKEGKLWDLRLMIDPSTGFSKGYCFVTYFNKEIAALAAKKLNDNEIRPGKPIRVNVSVANVRLFIGNIPKTKTKEELKIEFAKIVEGLSELIIFTGGEVQTGGGDDKVKNRGFCFLEFVDHKSASVAKRKLCKFNRVLNREIAVDWADPHEEPDEETMAKVKVLYVKNLAGEVSEDEVKVLFEQYGKLERVRKMKDYAFIHFEEREACLKAMEEQNGKLLGKSVLEISLARPLTDKKKQAQGNNHHQHQQQAYGGNANRGGGNRNNNYSNGGNNMNWNNNNNNNNNFQMSNGNNGRGGFNNNRNGGGMGNRGGFGGGNRGGINNNNNQRFNNNNNFNGNNMNRGGFGQNNNNNFNRGGNSNWNGNGGGNRSFGGNNNSFNNGNNNNNGKMNNNKRKNGGSLGGGNNMGDTKKFRFNQNNGNNMDTGNNWNNGGQQQPNQQISFDNQQTNGAGEQGNNVWYQDNFNSSSQWL